MAEGEVTTFTQEQVEDMIAQRVARATRGMPSAEELKEFKAWKDGEATRNAELGKITKERDDNKTALEEATKKLTKYEHEKILASKGVSSDDLDYFDFKISQMVDDKTTWEQACETYLKDHAPKKTRVDFSGSLGGSGGRKETTTSDIMNDLIRNYRK